MKKIIITLMSILTCLSLSFYFVGCSDDSGGSTAVGSYTGPGSQWAVTLNNNNTFVITRASTVGAAVELTVNGTYTTLSSGFLKLTVTSASGVDAPSAGAQAYAMNVPGFVFLLKPLDANSDIIPMVVSGTCPTTTTPYNWVTTSHESSGDNATDLTLNKDLLGTASYDPSASPNPTMTLPAKYDLQGNSLTAGDVMAGSCSNGIISLTGVATLFLSDSGAAIVATDPGQHIVALPQQTITLSDLDGEYSGLVFNESNSTKVEPVWLSFNSTGTTEANMWSDVDTGTKNTTNNITFSSITANSPSNGFVSMTTNEGGKTAPISCQAATNVASSGKNILFCVGVSADEYNGGAGVGDELFSVLLVSN